MKYRILISLLVFICCLNISCNDDSVNPEIKNENFTFPFNLNSIWYYGSRNFVSNIRPDSIISYFDSDTIIGYGGLTFLRDTIIKNDTLRLLRNTHSDPYHLHTALELYKQNQSGLYRHAYYSEGYAFSPYRNQSNIRLKIQNGFFSSTADVLNRLKNTEQGNESNSDTILTFDSPPLKAIMYPLARNSEWLLKEFDNIKIKKRYLDFENVRQNEKEYFCIKIKKSWYFNNSNDPDSNIIYHDYFSKEGIVKRYIYIKDIEVYSETGQHIGYIDVHEESFLNIFSP